MKITDLIAQKNGPFYSLEFFPPRERDQWDPFFHVVEQLKAVNPLFASVTYGAGGSTQEATLEIVSHIKKAYDIETMAHFTCVGASSDSIRTMLQKFRQGGIDNVLALRGDPPKDSTIDWDTAEFAHATDLVRFIKKEFPEFCVSVAGYPGLHPESPSYESDWRYTVAKVSEGADFVITQLFFDVREYFSLTSRLSYFGVTVPVIPGILPIQSFESLRRILSLCGANIPGKLYLDLEKAHNTGGTEAVKEAGIAYASQQIRSLLDGGAPGIHLYTLNRAESCLQLIDEVGLL